MSRCFPFPPPGYEKRARKDDVDLLKKEKHREKKHKKEKRTKRREKVKKKVRKTEVMESIGKRKTRREKTETRRRIRRKTGTPLKIKLVLQMRREIWGKLRVLVQRNSFLKSTKITVLTREILGKLEVIRPRSSVKIVIWLRRTTILYCWSWVGELKMRPEELVTMWLRRFLNQTERRMRGWGMVRLVAKDADILAEVKEKNKDKRVDDRKTDGQGIRVAAQISGNTMVQNPVGMVETKVEGLSRPLGSNVDRKIDGKEKTKEKEGDDKRREKRKEKDREKKKQGKDKDKEKKKEAKAKEKNESKNAEPGKEKKKEEKAKEKNESKIAELDKEKKKEEKAKEKNESKIAELDKEKKKEEKAKEKNESKIAELDKEKKKEEKAKEKNESKNAELDKEKKKEEKAKEKNESKIAELDKEKKKEEKAKEKNESKNAEPGKEKKKEEKAKEKNESKIAELDKEKKKEEKAKEKNESKNAEPDKIRKSNKEDHIDPHYVITSQLPKDSNKSAGADGNLKKRKDLQTNGVLHANDIRPSKLPRPSSSSHPLTVNGRTVEPCQTSTPYVSDRLGSANNVKVDNKDCKINGIIESPSLSVSPARLTSTAAQAVPVAKASVRPPHPDSRYLSQVYLVPKVDEVPDYDDEDWLFGCSGNQSKKPKVESSGFEETPEVWSEALRIESADVHILPYVIPY
ncbi:PREDICTED: stress response protein NST1-like isoform X1 [Prunus mume]|uniref:Stress response protein NST1-like isoform X1 n=1 Tax=Prunus mume TaxID=102107 RepID=A0ABM1LJD2_PRUMU|nr:PREDICTED: stress response protein NST1-like isoform X1 [Prunus mume]XP_016647509.1 PREDICTED: stress response protein NST1-like isoform X1 [Prunus mume]